MTYEYFFDFADLEKVFEQVVDNAPSLLINTTPLKWPTKPILLLWLLRFLHLLLLFVLLLLLC